MLKTFFTAVAALVASLPLAAAAAFPDGRPIRIVVPYAAGGPTDAMARILAEPLQKTLGVTIIVDNVPGAAGAIGASQVLRAPADGYTLFLGNNGPSAVTPLLQRGTTFDPVKDFTPLSMISRATMVLAVAKSVPANDMASFVTWARANSGNITYASAGIGSLGHLGSELLAKEAGFKWTHIPYKGMAPTLNALLGGEVQVLLTTPTDAMRGHVAAGTIKLVGVTSDTPSPLDPGADTVNKAVPGFTLYSWFALLVKSGTPPAIQAQLTKAINDAVANEDVKTRFKGLGVIAEGGAPEKVTELIKQDVARWSVIIRDNNIRSE